MVPAVITNNSDARRLGATFPAKRLRISALASLASCASAVVFFVALPVTEFLKCGNDDDDEGCKAAVVVVITGAGSPLSLSSSSPPPPTPPRGDRPRVHDAEGNVAVRRVIDSAAASSARDAVAVVAIVVLCGGLCFFLQFSCVGFFLSFWLFFLVFLDFR